MCEEERMERERVMRLFQMEEYRAILSPTKKVMKYLLDNEKNGRKGLSMTRACSIAGACRTRVSRKLKRIRNGFSYDGNGRIPLLNEEESKKLEEYIIQSIERRSCKTARQLVDVAKRILGERKAIYLMGESLSTKTIKRWLEMHGFTLSKPLTMYEAKAKSDRVTIAKMYENLHTLFQHGQYPDSLIFNMDETWVSTEKKQPRGYVVHTADTPPISFQPIEGKHVTLVACISKDGTDVPSAYILPTYLDPDKIKEIHGLQGIKYFYQRSGFMTNELMRSWLVHVFIPHVNTIRRSRDQHALLICDAHVSRHNANVWDVLKANNIDMLVLPAHVTSVVQPLDVGIFAKYKGQFREYYKDKGIYGLLQASVASFKKSTDCIAIDKAWNESKLFSPEWKEFIDTFPEQPFILATAHSRRSKANYVVTSFNIEHSVWV